MNTEPNKKNRALAGALASLGAKTRPTKLKPPEREGGKKIIIKRPQPRHKRRKEVEGEQQLQTAVYRDHVTRQLFRSSINRDQRRRRNEEGRSS
jgi:hypothetical protein